MEQLILHLVGDYVTQNHWMANRKTQSTIPCLVHVVLYTLPFLLLQPSWEALAVIAGTHFVIDRFRLAKYWCRFWGVGEPGWMLETVNRLLRTVSYIVTSEVTVPEPDGQKHDRVQATVEIGVPFQLQYPEAAPAWLAVWLLIIVDNTAHLAINYAALRWL